MGPGSAKLAEKATLWRSEGCTEGIYIKYIYKCERGRNIN